MEVEVDAGAVEAAAVKATVTVEEATAAAAVAPGVVEAAGVAGEAGAEHTLARAAGCSQGFGTRPRSGRASGRCHIPEDPKGQVLPIESPQTSPTPD